MKILFTICGRAGSKGIKNKNICNFVGKPLPYYSLSALDLYLKKHKVESDIVVNTDSQELINLMKHNGLRPVDIINRDVSLAGDIIGKIEVIKNCFIIMSERRQTRYDIVVDLDITSPLRTVSDIDTLIKVHAEKKPDVTTSVTTARRNPYFNQVMKTDHGFQPVIKTDFTSRQQAPAVYDMNASLYAYNPDFLKTNKGIFDGYCEVIEMMDTAILDLDHPHDLEMMEVIATYLFNNNQDYRNIYTNI